MGGSSSNARMHYFPASFIGGFSDPTARSAHKRPRDRQIWVARRDVPRPFRSTGDKVGYRPEDPRIYASPHDPDGSRLERLWAHAERDTARFQIALDLASESGAMPASVFVLVVAPFVATLLARHPTLVLDDGLSQLDSSSPGQIAAVEARRTAFARYCDALIYSRRWSLVRTDPVLSTTDIGWLWLPGASPGVVFLPTSPTTALLIDGGPASYSHDSEWVKVPRLDIPRGDVELFRDAMTVHAPTAVFASQASLARRALEIWGTQQEPADSSRNSLTPDALAAWPSYVTASLLMEGAAFQWQHAWSRFLVAQHRFDCRCEESMKEAGFGRQARREAARRRHKLLKAAEREVRGGRPRRPSGRTVGLVVDRQQPDDDVPPVLTVLGYGAPVGPLFKHQVGD